MTWDEHRKQYASLLLTSPGLTVSEYATAKGVSVNTARRELKGIKKGASKGDQPRDQKPDQKRDHSGDQASDQNNKKGKKASGSRASKGAAKLTRETAHPAATQNKGKGRNAKKITSGSSAGGKLRSIIHVPKARGQGVPFLEGNEYSIIHGRYAQPRECDIDEALHQMDEPDFFESLDARLMAKTFAHLNLIERARNRSMDVLQETVSTFKPDDGGTHPYHKELQMLLNAGAGIAETAKSIAHMRTNSIKTRRDQEVHEVKMSVLDAVAEVYRLKDARPEMTYGEMAEFVESRGGKVPPYILQMARIEALKPPAIADEQGEVSDEQLEHEARQYREMQLNKDSFLADRRAMVAQIVDENQYGDITSDGENREGEFIGGDFEEDEEFDLDATSDLYGPDDES